MIYFARPADQSCSLDVSWGEESEYLLQYQRQADTTVALGSHLTSDV